MNSFFIPSSFLYLEKKLCYLVCASKEESIEWKIPYLLYKKITQYEVEKWLGFFDSGG